MPDIDPLDVHAQIEAQEAAKQRARQLAREEADDIRWLMSGKRGRRIVRRILSRAGALDEFPSSFNTNAATMAFNEGRRTTAFALREQILAWCLKDYVLMLEEREEDA